MTSLEKKVENLIIENIENLGYELYDVIYAKEGKDYYLRILIDSKKGISIEDCERVSNSISDILDEADYIKEQYYLEVSSAGVERVLRQDKHFATNIGSKIEIKMFKPIENSKTIQGILKNYTEKNIEIEKDEKIIEIERENIAVIKTIYEW